MLCLLRLRRPPRSTLTYTLFPYTTLVRSGVARAHLRRGFEHDHAIAMGVPERLDRAAHPQRRDDRVERFGIGPPGGEREFVAVRSEEHTSELQSLMRISYAVFCLKKKKMNAH